MRSPVERFLARFEAFGDAPTVPNSLALFPPDATLFAVGVDHPITVPENPEHFESILKLVADFRRVAERHRELAARVAALSSPTAAAEASA